MIGKKIILFISLAMPIYAANTDDEIIKNLDFFQNLELMKDDNPFVVSTSAGNDGTQISGINNEIEKEVEK